MPASWRKGAVVVATAGSLGCNSIAGIDEPSDRVDAGIADGAMSNGDDGSTRTDAAGDLGESAVDPVVDAAQEPTSGSDASADRGPVPSLEGGTTTIQFQGSWFGSERNISQMSIHTPPSVHEHDLLWVALYTDYRSTDVTPAPGWTLSTERPNAANDFHSWWFYKIATANEPAEHPFSFNQVTVVATAAIVAYSGVDTGKPFDRSTAFDTHLSPCVAPAIQATEPSGLLFVASFVNDTASQWTAIDPINVRAKFEGVFVADYPQVGDAGAVDKAVGCTPAGEGAVMVMGLRPARL
jgi:hypothetical protein